jgi:hypothetical protein
MMKIKERHQLKLMILMILLSAKKIIHIINVIQSFLKKLMKRICFIRAS